MAAKTERVNGNMADSIPGPGWKLLIHIRSFDRALWVGKKMPLAGQHAPLRYGEIPGAGAATSALHYRDNAKRGAARFS
jgi:hypothetical protein